MFHFKFPSISILNSILKPYSSRLLDFPPGAAHTDVPEANETGEPQRANPASHPTLGRVSDPDNRERSDIYSNTIFRINDRWRVIVCPEGIQWILQKRKGYLDGRPAWDGMSFCRSKAGMYRAIKEKVGAVSPDTEAQLAQLPDWVES